MKNYIIIMTLVKSKIMLPQKLMHKIENCVIFVTIVIMYCVHADGSVWLQEPVLLLIK